MLSSKLKKSSLKSQCNSDAVRKSTPSIWERVERSVKVLTWLSIFFGLFFHFLGQLARQSYLERLGLVGAIFEKSLYQIELKGFEVFVGSFASILPSDDAQTQTLIWMGKVAVFCGAFSVLINILITNSPKAKHALHKVPVWLGMLNLRVKKFFITTFIIFLAQMMIVPVPLLLLSALVLPVLLVGSAAVQHGKNEAEKALSYFQLPKEKQLKSYYVRATWRKEKRVDVNGFLVDSSDKYIAMYDDLSGKILVLDLKDATIEIEVMKQLGPTKLKQ